MSRGYKPTKQMKKLNWEKLPHRVAAKSGTVWEPTAAPTAKTRVSISAEHVVELFSRQEVVKNKKGPSGDQPAAKPKVVSIF